jgi:hypothetical protein
MRRFFVVMSLMALSACGGSPAEESAPAAEEREAQAGCTSGDSWACYCAQFKTSDTCRQANLRRCVWAYNKCSPTYE